MSHGEFNSLGGITLLGISAVVHWVVGEILNKGVEQAPGISHKVTNMIHNHNEHVLTEEEEEEQN